jgi:hypothetical protein
MGVFCNLNAKIQLLYFMLRFQRFLFFCYFIELGLELNWSKFQFSIQ